MDPTDFLGMGKDGSVEELGKLWGPRGELRRTLGDEGLTRALGFASRMVELGFTEMRGMGRLLTDGRGSTDGWDTQQLIKALAATKAHTVVTPSMPNPSQE